MTLSKLAPFAILAVAGAVIAGALGVPVSTLLFFGVLLFCPLMMMMMMGGMSKQPPSAALSALQERFAKGEISQQEFTQKKQLIGGGA